MKLLDRIFKNKKPQAREPELLRWVHHPDVRWRVKEGASDLVQLLDSEGGVAADLNSVGSLIWTACSEPRTREEILKRVLDGFQTTPAAAGKDLDEFLEDSHDRGILSVVGNDGLLHPSAKDFEEDRKALGRVEPDLHRAREGPAGEKAALAERLRGTLRKAETAFGVDSLEAGWIVGSLASVLYEDGQYAAALPHMRRALRLKEKRFGPGHLLATSSMNNLGLLLLAMRRSAEARPFLERALKIRLHHLSQDDPAVAQSLSSLSALLMATGAEEEARPLIERALEIRALTSSRKSPDVPGAVH